MADMNLKHYEALIGLAGRIRNAGIVGIVVFKPRLEDSEDPAFDWPDMILASTADAKVIAALLGNSDEGYEEECGDNE